MLHSIDKPMTGKIAEDYRVRLADVEFDRGRCIVTSPVYALNHAGQIPAHNNSRCTLPADWPALPLLCN